MSFSSLKTCEFQQEIQQDSELHQQGANVWDVCLYLLGHTFKKRMGIKEKFIWNLWDFNLYALSFIEQISEKYLNSLLMPANGSGSTDDCNYVRTAGSGSQGLFFPQNVCALGKD